MASSEELRPPVKHTRMITHKIELTPQAISQAILEYARDRIVDLPSGVASVSMVQDDAGTLTGAYVTISEEVVHDQ